jgi:hypothetical protein
VAVRDMIRLRVVLYLIQKQTVIPSLTALVTISLVVVIALCRLAVLQMLQLRLYSRRYLRPGPPPAPVAPGPVLVPSTRPSTPFSGQMPVGYGSPQTGQIDPYSLSEMQRYRQMLARLGQARSPIGLADGGSVLDAAAGRFLESLTAA